MGKKAALLLVLAAFVISLYGCEAVNGVKTALRRADDWVQQNFW